MTQRFIRRAWYFGCWSQEVPIGSAKEVNLLGESIAVYRSESGGLNALGNRCPHRFAPLHKGVVRGEALECAYHGLQFGPKGNCVFSPHHRGANPSGIKVQAYAAAEKHGAVWLWGAEAELADPASIPDLSELDVFPETAIGSFPSMDVQANYELLIDNLFDPTHADWVHYGILGDGLLSLGKAKVEKRDGSIEATWHYEGQIVVPILRPIAADGSVWDSWVSARWYAPSIICFGAGVMPTGRPVSEGMWLNTYHILVPTGPDSCTYAVKNVRNHDLEDGALTARTVESSLIAFNEQDKPMIEAQQAMMRGRGFWDLKPALLPSDGPAIIVRRALEEMIERERLAKDVAAAC